MKAYLISPGSKAGLDKRSPNDTSAFAHLTKDTSVAALSALRDEIRQEQVKLLASRGAKVLIIFQSMDAGGKDGTVRNVFAGLDPHGLSVVGFKAPTPAELDHDFLWRIHSRCPGKGEIAIFNRSHYEDVLAVRVKKLAPDIVWQRRYEHILAFEKMLAEEGTLIVKFFLHIDKEEQRKRFESRLKNPEKHWKICEEDLRDRARFGDFQLAYEDVFNRTSTPHAPWYVVPANSKWCRNLIVATIVRDSLRSLKLTLPGLNPNLRGVTLG